MVTLQRLSTQRQSINKLEKPTKARTKISRKNKGVVPAGEQDLLMTKCDYLYDYSLQFNIYQKKWHAVPKGRIVEYLNGELKLKGFDSIKDLLHTLKKKHATTN